MLLPTAADIHNHKFAEFDFIDPKLGFSRRLADCLEVLYRLGQHAKKVDAANVLIVGDLFHKMGIIEVETYNLVFMAVQALAKEHKVHLVRGNHDQATKDGAQHSLFPFSAIPNVHIHDGPFTLKDNGESVDVAFIPYSDDEQKTMARVKKLRGRDIAFMHHGFRGSRTGSTLEHVVKEPLDPVKVGKHFKFVYSGHYHTLQFVHKNVMYIGSPMEHTRSDITDDGKGFIVVNTNKLSKPEFVPLSLPRFVRLEGEEGFTFAREHAKGNFVDFQLDSDTEDAAYAVEARLKKLGARGWIIHPYVEPKRKKEKSERRVDVVAGMGVEKIVRAAAKKRCPPTLNAKRLERLMLEVLREAEARR